MQDSRCLPVLFDFQTSFQQRLSVATALQLVNLEEMEEGALGAFQGSNLNCAIVATVSRLQCAAWKMQNRRRNLSQLQQTPSALGCELTGRSPMRNLHLHIFSALFRHKTILEVACRCEVRFDAACRCQSDCSNGQATFKHFV